MTYKEKLLDPRWQKKRLEVLERDGWACRALGGVSEEDIYWAKRESGAVGFGTIQELKRGYYMARDYVSPLEQGAVNV